MVHPIVSKIFARFEEGLRSGSVSTGLRICALLLFGDVILETITQPPEFTLR